MDSLVPDKLREAAQEDRRADGDNDQRYGAHAADHDELALGEIDDAARVEDNGIAQRHQRIDGAGGQAAGEELRPLAAHAQLSVSAAARYLTSVQPPLRTWSIRNAVRSSPMWSALDMLTTPPVPT